MASVHGDGGVELVALHPQVSLEVVQAGLRDGVSVDVVEEVHWCGRLDPGVPVGKGIRVSIVGLREFTH